MRNKSRVRINPLALLILLAGWLTPATARAQEYPAVHTERPRIYIDDARFAWMRENKDLPGDFQTTYQAFEYRYNNWWINDPELYLTGEDSTQWTWNWNSVYAKNEAVFAIFMFTLNRDELALKRCRFLATKAIEALETADYAAMAWFDKEDFLRLFSDVASLLVDWCHDDLPADMRDRLIRAHYTMTREFMTTFILSAAGNSYVSSHNAWNNVFVNQDLLVLHHADALTLAQRDTIDQWYRVIYDKWIDGFLPVYGYYRDDDGGWNWGAAYALWSLIDQFQFFDNMLIATGKDFYTDLPWVRNSINQYWYFIRPDEWSIHHGDGITFLAGDRAIYRHAAIFHDPRSVWLADQYSTPGYYYSTPIVFQKLLFKDFTPAPVPHPQPPLDWWSDKVGLSVSRSSWEKDALMTTFFNSPSKRAAHEHRDNNSFTVFKKKPLLVDAGTYDTYGGSHYLNYYQRTIAHNSICVYDSTETYTNFGQPVSNDGGQIESVALQNLADLFKPQNQRGTWINYVGRGDFQYSVADAQLSYAPDKLDFFRRRFLVLKPSRIIILDHLHLNQAGSAQRDAAWIGHFMQRPSISGDLLQAPVPGHIEAYAGPDFFLADGDASLSARTLLPAHATTTLIGGEGYEYWVDGVNYPPISPPDTLHGTPGRWRVEVRPDTVTDSLVFLHTLMIGDSLIFTVPDGTPHKNAHSVGADWSDILFFFPANGDTGVTYHVFLNVPGQRITSIFACDLADGWYSVVVDDKPVASALSTDGILRTYILLLPGGHKVEIMPFITSTSDPAAQYPVRVYPNPADDQIVVTITDETWADFTAELIDVHGRRVAQRTGRKTLVMDASGMPNGQYFLRVTDGRAVHTSTVTVLH